MSMEDRIHKSGNHEKFTAAVSKFRKSPRNRDHEHQFYEALTNCGATPEEADEYIDLYLQGGD